MTKTFKTILGLILAWALVAQAGIAQSPNITSMHTAATTTANGTALVVNGPAGNPANTIGAAGVQIANSAGTFTITFETLTSGSTWTAVMATNMTDDVRATTATAAGQYTILLGGAVQLRARISACSSCSVTVVGRLVPGLVARVASSGGGGGSGDFVGPASSTDNAIVRFDGTTGKLGQNSVVLVGDTGNVTGLGTLNTHTIPGGTGTFALTSGLPVGANPTASLGLTAVNGSASTFLRSDGAPALDVTIAPTWTGVHTHTNTIALTSTTAANNKITQGAAINIGATSTDGIILQNTTAAAAGAQQWSPRLHWIGQGWKTTATAASQTVDYIAELVPVQAAANPTANLQFSYQVNGGGYTAGPLMNTSGQIIGPSSGTQPNFAVGGTTGYGVGSSGGSLAFYGNGNVTVYNNGTTEWRYGSGQSITFSSASSPVGTAGDIGFLRSAAGVLRITSGGSGQGNVLIGSSTVGGVGTSGVGVLAFGIGTAPSSSPVSTAQVYSVAAATNDAQLYARNEAAEVNRLTGLAARNSAQFDKTSSTTLANITGLTRNLEAGRTYAFRAVVQSTAIATGGVKFAVSGTATATAISYEGTMSSGAVLATQTRATALDTTVCASTTTTAGTCYIEGVIQVNAAGTLTIQFAQNNSDGTASSVLANSYLQLIPIS